MFQRNSINGLSNPLTPITRLPNQGIRLTNSQEAYKDEDSIMEDNDEEVTSDHSLEIDLEERQATVENELIPTI